MSYVCLWQPVTAAIPTRDHRASGTVEFSPRSLTSGPIRASNYLSKESRFRGSFGASHPATQPSRHTVVERELQPASQPAGEPAASESASQPTNETIDCRYSTATAYDSRHSRKHHSFGMLHIAALFLYFTAVWTISTGNTAVLLYPQNTVFQFTIGISLPVVMGKRGGIAFSSGFQFNYALPWNLSQLEPSVLPAREIGSFDLQDVYVALEDLLEKHGWRGGGSCLLRSICELAETPILAPETAASPGQRHQPDILEEIIHLLLTPSQDLPEAVNSSHRSAGKLYQEAERLGSSGVDCRAIYPDCIESPLESFTEIAFP